jgi:hypothetical protein
MPYPEIESVLLVGILLIAVSQLIRRVSFAELTQGLQKYLFEN